MVGGAVAHPAPTPEPDVVGPIDGAIHPPPMKPSLRSVSWLGGGGLSAAPSRSRFASLPSGYSLQGSVVQ